MANDDSAMKNRADYRELLDNFRAAEKPNRDSVRHLESLGYTSGQARNAVYQYRKEKGLVRSRAAPKNAE